MGLRESDSFELDSRRGGEGVDRSLVESLIRAGETDRQRINDLLHADTLQILSFLAARIDRLAPVSRHPAMAAAVSGLDELVRQAIARVRNVAFELRPVPLEGEPVAEGLRRTLEAAAARHRFAYDVHDRVRLEPSLETRIVLFRIAEEAIRNAARHAQASRIDAAIDTAEEGCLVAIEDDGRGFDPTAIREPEPAGSGIESMRARATLVGGWLRIASGPGMGTLVEFWLPMSEGGR